MDRLIALGVSIVIVGFLVITAGILLSQGKTEVRGGGVVFLGPIPLVFGTDKSMAVTAAVLGLALMAAYYLLFMR